MIKRVYCAKCRKVLGTNKNGHYNLIEGCIQSADVNRKIVSYCPKKCYHSKSFNFDKPRERKLKDTLKSASTQVNEEIENE
jgi:hypothetical protein